MSPVFLYELGLLTAFASEQFLEGNILIVMRNYLASVIIMATLTACGTTTRFVDQPQLTIDGAGRDVHQATADLFDASTPYTIRLCEADPVSKRCNKGSSGIRAHGVGGLLLPLALYISGMTVSKQTPSDEGWAIDTSFHSKVDTIAPLCRTAHGQILLRSNNTVSVKINSFYCNWALVGNVLVTADLSLDQVNIQEKAFTGFYKVSFHGTGNAAGSGYYRAEIVPSTT